MNRFALLTLFAAVALACSDSPGEVNTTETIYPYPTGWAASGPVTMTGNLPVGYWIDVGRDVGIYKVSSTSRLKVTYSDDLRAGLDVAGGDATVEVRMNGGSMAPRCWQEKYHLGSGNFVNPYATVCVTDALPAGAYSFEVWVNAVVGTALLSHNVGQSLLLVEELPDDGSWAASPVPTGSFVADNSGSTYVNAPARDVSFAKRSATSLLKVTLADTLRVGYGMVTGYGTMMVLMDGTPTSCFAGQYDSNGGGINSDFHEPFVMTCVLDGVAVGDHTFSVQIRSGTSGAATAGTTYLGWQRSSPLLMVEELPAARVTYKNDGGDTGDVTSTAAPGFDATGRTVTHDVSAGGKTVKLTFSDTFRGTGNQNNMWGYVHVRLDDQDAGCYVGQYSGGAGTQDHHRPINVTCLFRNLSAGPHTFKVSSWSGAGANRFGWNRGQNLMLVEELP